MTRKGFFEDEKPRVKRVRRSTPGEPRVKKKRGCSECGLDEKCETPDMEMGGEGERGILVMAEAPGAEEDRDGTQLVGKVGRYLEKKMDLQGISLHDDCFKINAVNCRPPKNREPTPLEIECCRPKVWKCITENKPKFTLLFGQAAVESYIGHRYSRTKIGKIGTWRGWIIPDRTTRSYVFPMYHPSYATRNRGEIEEKVFLRDLNTALNFINMNPGTINTGTGTCPMVLFDPDTILERLEYVYDECPVISFDYETTGIKPQADGHEIVCCGVGLSDKVGFAFPLTLPRVQKAWKKILRSKSIRKVCHNKKFESIWSKEILGVWPNNIIWDTMLMAHYLDNRPGISSLKFQSYVNFGVVGYDQEIDPFLRSKEKSANSFNRVKEAPQKKLLEYCATDAILTLKLYHKQQWKMERWKKGEENVLET